MPPTQPSPPSQRKLLQVKTPNVHPPLYDCPLDHTHYRYRTLMLVGVVSKQVIRRGHHGLDWRPPQIWQQGSKVPLFVVEHPLTIWSDFLLFLCLILKRIYPLSTTVLLWRPCRKPDFFGFPIWACLSYLWRRVEVAHSMVQVYPISSTQHHPPREVAGSEELVQLLPPTNRPTLHTLRDCPTHHMAIFTVV